MLDHVKKLPPANIRVHVTRKRPRDRTIDVTRPAIESAPRDELTGLRCHLIRVSNPIPFPEPIPRIIAKFKGVASSRRMVPSVVECRMSV